MHHRHVLYRRSFLGRRPISSDRFVLYRRPVCITNRFCITDPFVSQTRLYHRPVLYHRPQVRLYHKPVLYHRRVCNTGPVLCHRPVLWHLQLSDDWKQQRADLIRIASVIPGTCAAQSDLRLTALKPCFLCPSSVLGMGLSRLFPYFKFVVNVALPLCCVIKYR